MSTAQILLLLFGLELGLVIMVLGGLLWWRRRRRAVSGEAEATDDAEHPAPALYLDRELALTRSRVEALGDAAPEGLHLRLAWLGLEREIAEQNGSGVDEAFWETLPGRIEAILAAVKTDSSAAEDDGAGTAAVTTANDPEEADAGSVIERQARTIDYLRGYIAELVKRAGGDDEGRDDVEAQFAEIERINQELRGCVTVLEDENRFLREQVATLLKLED